MTLEADFVKIVQDLVLSPDFGNAIVIFFLSFANELVAILPYAVILSGQLLFLEGPLTLALFGKLFIFVAIPVGVGSSIGTIPVYLLAYFGGKPAIKKFERYLFFSWKDVEKVSSRLKGEWYDEMMFLVLRSVPLLSSLPVSVAAGVLRMRFLTYFVITTIGFTLRMMLTLVIVGLGVESLSQLLIFIYNI